jgi:hypothetical protein
MCPGHVLLFLLYTLLPILLLRGLYQLYPRRRSLDGHCRATKYYTLLTFELWRLS